MTHPLEIAYALSATELLDAVAKRFRLRAALEGAVAEVHTERQIQALLGSLILRYVPHDLDSQPDFSIWLPGVEKPLRIEAKNIRESSKKGGEAYRQGGQRGLQGGDAKDPRLEGRPGQPILRRGAIRHSRRLPGEENGRLVGHRLRQGCGPEDECQVPQKAVRFPTGSPA